MVGRNITGPAIIDPKPNQNEANPHPIPHLFATTLAANIAANGIKIEGGVLITECILPTQVTSTQPASHGKKPTKNINIPPPNKLTAASTPTLSSFHNLPKLKANNTVITPNREKPNIFIVPIYGDFTPPNSLMLCLTGLYPSHLCPNHINNKP